MPTELNSHIKQKKVREMGNNMTHQESFTS